MSTSVRDLRVRMGGGSQLSESHVWVQIRVKSREFEELLHLSQHALFHCRLWRFTSTQAEPWLSESQICVKSTYI